MATTDAAGRPDRTDRRDRTAVRRNIERAITSLIFLFVVAHGDSFDTDRWFWLVLWSGSLTAAGIVLVRSLSPGTDEPASSTSQPTRRRRALVARLGAIATCLVAFAASRALGPVGEARWVLIGVAIVAAGDAASSAQRARRATALHASR